MKSPSLCVFRIHDRAEEAGRLASAIADEFWALYATDGRLDWTAVERHLAWMAADARERARRTVFVDAPGRSAAEPRCERRRRGLAGVA